jgi:hypothetical protein
MKKYHFLICALLALLLSRGVQAQHIVDVSVGVSLQDKLMTTLAYRHQFSDRFRAGLEVQYGAPRYRFVDAKPIREGYAATFTLPMSLRLYEKEALRLDLFVRPGYRTQGVLDPDKNDTRDSILNATAILFEPGLVITMQASERLNIQSGISFPIAFQNAPTSLFESAHTPLIYGGFGLKTSEKSTFFAKSLFGSAVGGDGDTYKFSYSLQGGMRFAFGSKPVTKVVEPSF